MDDRQFSGLLPLMTAALVQRIGAVYHLSEDDAIAHLYDSKLYALLEQEDTKLWHYSVEKLFDLYQSEVEHGKLDLPEY
jgi:hypothetical protein